MAEWLRRRTTTQIVAGSIPHFAEIFFILFEANSRPRGRHSLILSNQDESTINLQPIDTKVDHPK